MKKIFLLFILSMLFTSCSDYFFEHNFCITNNSNFEVSFKINNYDNSIYTLAPGEKVYKNLYDNPKITLLGNPRVYFVSGVSSGEIKNLQKFEVTITNSCLYPVLLSEENNMLGDTYGDKIMVLPDSSLKVALYTSKPIFKAIYIKDNEEYNATPYLIITP